jgi:hypothetical protein
MTVAQLSALLGISSRTFYRHLKTDKKLLQAFEEGQQAGVGEVVHALKDLIRKGNLGAIIFWLKTKIRTTGRTTAASTSRPQLNG